jgi:hypothetical protein
VAELFDGGHTIEQTMARLPSNPADLLQPGYAKLLRNPTGVLAGAARVNDNACLRWKPSVPVQMYAAHGDPEAVYANSARCKESLGTADLTLTDVGDVDHITSLVLSIPQVARWFATLK